jgi:hypothetical protein
MVARDARLPAHTKRGASANLELPDELLGAVPGFRIVVHPALILQRCPEILTYRLLDDSHVTPNLLSI